MIHRYERFSASVAILYRDIQRIERMEMARFGLKGPHAQCLLALHQSPEGLTSVQLCEKCGKDKAAISRTVSELEAAGMLRRAGNAYRAALTLTEPGTAAAEAVSRRVLLAVEKAGEGLQEQQRQVFYQVLDLIAGNLHAICEEGLPEKTK